MYKPCKHCSKDRAPTMDGLRREALEFAKDAARKSAGEVVAKRIKEDARKARMDDFAKRAMASLIASGNYTSRDRWEVAKAAKAFADAMIVTLEEE